MFDPADDAPEGFSLPFSSRLRKAPPRRTTTPAEALPPEGLQKAARAVAAGPVAVTHGKPRGAHNALAFHQWGRGQSVDGGDGDAPKDREPR